MRCIEMLTMFNNIEETEEININMRCIEIPLPHTALILYARLTLTWDVLKYVHWQAKNKRKGGLTLTWDVLKSKNLC